jgi:hypothetical protein
MAARRRGLTVRVTDDFVVNFNKASWFIELENWFWTSNQRRFKGISFEQWAREVVKPFRPFFSIRFQKSKGMGFEQTVAGAYTCDSDRVGQKPIQLTVFYEKWPEFSDTMRRRALMFEFVKVVTHELNHQRQYRVRKYFNPTYVDPYYHDPDEIQSWALNASQSVVARYGIRRAKKVFGDFSKVSEKRYCSEHKAYANMPNKVKKRFLQHIARYLAVYDDYYQGSQDSGVPRQLLKKC